MSTLRVLVTGAAGFIGSHTVDRLLREGHEVIAVDNFRTGRATNIRQCAKHASFIFEFGDVSQEKVLESFCLKYRPEVVIHLAGLVSVVQAQNDPDLNYLLNIQTTHTVAEAARVSGVRRVVFASSAAVYGDAPQLPVDEESITHPISLYGSAKRISEQILEGHTQSFGLETISLRFFNVYGPRQDPQSPYSGVLSIFANRFESGEPVTVFGDGSQTRDFISVLDVARALSLAVSTSDVDSATCNVCTGKPTSVMDVVREFQALFPFAPEPHFGPPREGEILHSVGDPQAASETLSFLAEISVKEGLRSLVDASRPETVTHPRLVPQLA